MKLEQSFEVEAPLDQVWAALVDVERVAPCLPGAAVTGRNDDGSYNGTFTIKIGPTTASYTGKLEMQDIDDSAHSATMHAQGSDRRGQGGATATISSRLTPTEGRTRVEVVTDYHITGRLARFGRGGMIEDISERLLREFAGRLQSSLGGSGQAAGPSAGGAPAADEATGDEDGESALEQPTVEAPTVSEAEPEVETAPASAEEMETAPAEAAAPPPTEMGTGAEAFEASGPAAPPPPTEAGPPPPPAEAAPVPPPQPGPPPPEAAPPPPPQGAPPPPPQGGPPPTNESAPPVQGLSLVGGVLLDRVKRNPLPVIAVAGGLVLVGVLFRRR